VIESFKVDHTKLTAPCIRLAKVFIKDDVIIKKYDLRFVTPNTTYIDDKTIHSMEHLLATAFKKEFGEDMIDLSPMGCKTGFYYTTFDTPELESRIIIAIKHASKVRIPKPTEKNCGSYLLHNVEGARKFIKRISRQIEGEI